MELEFKNLSGMLPFVPFQLQCGFSRLFFPSACLFFSFCTFMIFEIVCKIGSI